jgi:hypothetical protein
LQLPTREEVVTADQRRSERLAGGRRTVCNNKFLQAVAEGLQAVETFHEAQGTIDTLVENLDDAVSRQTGKLRVRANRVTEADEDLPLGLISILVCAADRQREVEVCEMRPARAGYPIAVRSFSNAQTWCPDPESLEHHVLEIVRDARFGAKLQALMTDSAQPVEGRNP